MTTRAHPPTVTEQQLYEQIWRRHTNRQPFEKKPVSFNIVAELESAAWQERTHLWLLHQPEPHMLLADIKEADRNAAA